MTGGAASGPGLSALFPLLRSAAAAEIAKAFATEAAPPPRTESAGPAHALLADHPSSGTEASLRPVGHPSLAALAPPRAMMLRGLALPLPDAGGRVGAEGRQTPLPEAGAAPLATDRPAMAPRLSGVAVPPAREFGMPFAAEGAPVSGAQDGARAPPRAGVSLERRLEGPPVVLADAPALEVTLPEVTLDRRRDVARTSDAAAQNGGRPIPDRAAPRAGNGPMLPSVPADTWVARGGSTTPDQGDGSAGPDPVGRNPAVQDGARPLSEAVPVVSVPVPVDSDFPSGPLPTGQDAVPDVLLSPDGVWIAGEGEGALEGFDPLPLVRQRLDGISVMSEPRAVPEGEPADLVPGRREGPSFAARSLPPDVPVPARAEAQAAKLEGDAVPVAPRAGTVAPLPDLLPVANLAAALPKSVADGAALGAFPFTLAGAPASTAALVIFNAAMIPSWPPALALDGGGGKAGPIMAAGVQLAEMSPQEAAEYLAKMAATFGFLLTVKKRLALSLKEEKETLLGLFALLGVAMDVALRGLQMAFDLSAAQQELAADVAMEQARDPRGGKRDPRRKLTL